MPHPRRILAPAAGALVLGALYLFTRTHVTIADEGLRQAIRTHAPTVGRALHEAGVSVLPEDLVSPPADAALEPGQTITIDRAGLVNVLDGDQHVVVRTRDASPWAILQQAGIQAQPGDSVLLDGVPLGAFDSTPNLIPQSVVVRRAVPTRVIDGGVEREIRTSAATVGEALWEAGVRLYSGDGASPDLGAAVSEGLTVTIARSVPVEIRVDGQTIRTRTHRARVGEVLNDAGVVLVGHDFARPALDDPLPTDVSIEVVRVKEEVVTEQEYFPFGVAYQPSADLELDTTAVLQAGTNGISARRIRVRYENGAEVSRAVEAEWVAKDALPKIIGYGTNIVVRTLDTPNGPVEYWRAIRMYATSYSASRSGTPKTAPWYGRTRTGKVLTVGMVAVDPRVIPLGTPLYIPGYGFASAEDTGGGVKGKWIDLGYDDWNYVSWHSYVTVYVRTPIPPGDQIPWVLP